MLKYTCTAILVIFWLESCDYVTVLWSLDIQTEKLLNQNKFFEWKQNFWMKIRFLNGNSFYEWRSDFWMRLTFLNENEVFELN